MKDVTKVSDNLRFLMEKNKLTQSDIARICNVKQPSVSTWLKTGDMKIENLLALCRHFRISVDELIYGERPQSGFAPAKRIPLLSMVEAGKLTEIPACEYERYIFVAGDIPDNCFALDVEGDSMTSQTGGESIPSGSVVIVEPCCFSRDLNHQVVIATLGDLATMKELVVEGKNIYLKPWNSRFDVIKVDSEDFEIIGRVISYQMRVGRGR